MTSIWRPRGDCSRTPALPMSCGPDRPARIRNRPTTPCSAAGCGSSRSGAVIASATTRSCWRRRPARGPATARSTSARASAPRGWRSRCACPDVDVTLVEIDPELVGLAAENVERNGLEQRVRAVTLDVAAPADDFAAPWLGPGSADHVLMNPPFNDPARQNVSPDPDRRAAHAAGDGVLAGLGRRGRAGAALGRHADADLARRRLGDVLAALATASATSRCCRFMAAPDSRRSASWCAPARAAARRSRCCRD